jgi:hypothetical protein
VIEAYTSIGPILALTAFLTHLAQCCGPPEIAGADEPCNHNACARLRPGRDPLLFCNGDTITMASTYSKCRPCLARWIARCFTSLRQSGCAGGNLCAALSAYFAGDQDVSMQVVIW